MKFTRLLYAASIFVLMLFSAFVFAQGAVGSTTGSLSGVVQDESGAPLPGVLVSATGKSGVKSATTDLNGKFLFPYLEPGPWDLKAELSGYTTVEQLEIPIRLGLRADVAIKMRAGVEELVVVTETAPTVDVSSTTTGANITDELITSIPVGRGFAATIALAPGVSDAGIAGSNLAISGASGLENTYIIDGVNITDPGYGAVGAYSIRFGSLGSGFTTDMVKEVQVKSGGFEPEYGQALGGVVNVITKSGGNEFAGDAYVYFSPGSLEGDREFRDFEDSFIFNTEEDENLDGGINLSGPIIRDKLFFFGAYSPRRVETTLVNDPNAPAFDQFPDAVRTRTTNAYSTKVTANLTANHTVEFDAFGDPSTGDLGFQNALGLIATNPAIQRSELDWGSNSQTGRWTGILRPDMFAEVQIARAHNEFKETFGPEGNVYQFRDFTLPVVVVSGGLGFFDAGSIGTNVQYGLKLTNIWNDHEIRYGLQYEDIDYSGGGNYTGPTYTAFNGQQTSTGAIVNIQTGASIGRPDIPVVYVTLRNLLTQTPVPTTTKYLNLFVQDSWNLTDRLNIKGGIRAEQQKIKGDLEGSEDITFAWNFAPRVGASYDYLGNGKSKIYGHFGRFYEKVPNDLAVRALVTGTTSSGAYYDAELSRPVPGTGVISGGHATEVEGLASEELLAEFGLPQSTFETKSQYSNEYILGFEQEIFPGTSAGARYIHRDVGRVIEDIQINTDAPCVEVGGRCIGPGMIAEDFLFYSSAYFITNLDGHFPGFPEMVRDYDAFEFTVERRMLNNWQLLGSYRYARLEGNYEGLFRRDNGQSDPNITSLGDFAQCRQNPDGTCTNSEFIGATFNEGPLPNDVKHQVKIFGSYLWDMGLTTGFALNFSTGSPITELGAIPFYGSTERLLTDRGALGRSDNITTFDVHADYGIDLGPGRVTIGFDVFNLFNSQNVTTLTLNSEKDNRSYNPRPNPDFLSPFLFQDPRVVRLLAKFSF